MAIDTGLGATIAFTDSSFAASFTTLGGTEMTREMLDSSHLGTTDYMTKIVGDLVDPGGFDIEYFFDPAATIAPITAAAETITITFPLGSLTTAAIIAGTGAFTSSGTPELVAGGLMKGSGKIEWTDGFTFTKEV